MKALPCLLLYWLLLALPVYSQTSSLDRPRPVKIVTTDLNTYEGMVVNITTDYIVLDLSKDKKIMVNTPYYLRPEGDNYRIDVEYIQTLHTKKRKEVGKSALYGSLSGLVLFGGSVFLKDVEDDDWLKNAAIASVIGAIIGGIVGTFSSLIIKKTWHINGSSVELAAFRDYYF